MWREMSVEGSLKIEGASGLGSARDDRQRMSLSLKTVSAKDKNHFFFFFLRNVRIRAPHIVLL